VPAASLTRPRPIAYELVARDPTGARAGVLHTRRGPVPTPTFMPVGTHATIGNLSAEEVATTGAKIILGNTYHLMLRPGADVFRQFGGIHGLMKWDGLVLTDSGGFQIFSLPDKREITEKGARFRSHHDNSRQLLSPESSIAIQQAINSDIMMVLDVCLESTVDEKRTREAMERTHRWALRSLAARDAGDTGQALFAIVQGGVHRTLREQSAAFLTAHPFDGFAIGGLAVGETQREREEMTAVVTGKLPEDRPRYLMGVGTPVDLLEAVRRGVDMFDCIIPTKMAQQAYAHTFDGLIRLSRPAYRLSAAPIEEGCDCTTCLRYSRAYLNHLLRGQERLGVRLLSLHNTHHFQRLMRRAREAILEGTYDALRRQLSESYSA
jgi:queuine tRNA-ribosyltransferase